MNLSNQTQQRQGVLKMKTVTYQIAGLEYTKPYTNALHQALNANRIVYFVSK